MIDRPIDRLSSVTVSGAEPLFESESNISFKATENSCNDPKNAYTLDKNLDIVFEIQYKRYSI